MKREKDIYDKIISIENLVLSESNARKGKEKSYGVRLFDRNKEENLKELHKKLSDNIFKFSEYKTMYIKEYDKVREIKKVPYYPDRIVHHAIMNVMNGIFISVFTADTYACVKGRGINKCRENVVKALKDKEGTKYCLKTDIKKFYPSIDNEILKQLLRRKIKDKKALYLFDSLIDTTAGVPIGNYTSQNFANFYLSYFDHYVKETLKVKYYYRYCDDMVFLSDSKEFLHDILNKIKDYLKTNLKLEIKDNYQIFPVDSRSIDFVGFRFYHSHILLRKRIKKNFCRKVAKLNKQENITIKQYKQDIASWLGWCKYSNSRNLLKKIIKKDYYESIF
jgi:RNA-directed DNA polymerase